MRQTIKRITGKSQAFTLIELLIVIAIIAILALIAVPNFLEAQVRAKVSRCHADHRSIGVAVEAYAVDWGVVPLGQTAVTKSNCHPVPSRRVLDTALPTWSRSAG